MNNNIRHLYQIAQKESRLIIGLMSGTSLDGLDIALCRISGDGMDTKLVVEQFATAAYDDLFRDEVRSVFSKKLVSLEKLTVLNAWIAQQHAAMILGYLREWKIDVNQVDLVASHGQTIYHAPKALHPEDIFGNATLQIGDGDHLAMATGIVTVNDFRQKHIAAGGEGAPLAVYGDHFIFSKKDEPRILLNIGGIANFTHLPGAPEGQGIFSTDTGPGNTMMDAFMQKHFGEACDRDGMVAASGAINEDLLAALLDHPFFSEPFPKTTGPELFNLAYLESAHQKAGTTAISQQDTVATLNRFTAVTIAAAIEKTVSAGAQLTIYTSGGGMHNPVLISHLQNLLPRYLFETTGSLSIQPDAKEAVLFAILANEAVAGGKTAMGDEIPFVSMGKISFPQ